MRVTGPLLKVLNDFLDHPADDLYGLQIIRDTGLKSGTLYPILDRLVDEGWLEARWENDLNRKGPRRRLYRLTGLGVHEARQLLIEHSLGGDVAWTR